MNADPAALQAAASRFAADGFASVPGVLDDAACDVVLRALARDVAAAAEGAASPGDRGLLALPWCRDVVRAVRAHATLAALVPPDRVAVQCTYFEKSVDRNWLVPVHQDLAIPVAARVDHGALRGWSEKGGAWFVQPPDEVLAQLVAVRLHLDPCGADDGALQVVPGSHVHGRVDPATAARLRREGPIVACTQSRGDALALRPLLLHASSRATGASRRRVLHLLFGPRVLPFGLRWREMA